MQYNYYSYEKPEASIIVSKMPIWFNEVKFEGDQKEGSLNFHSQNEYDEIYGSNAKMDISWEQMDRLNVYHAKEVQKSIDIYNAIGMVITSKEDSWLNSHEFTSWEGSRSKMMRKRYYKENSMHGVFYCDVTSRVINVHVNVINKYYENFKPFILKSFTSILCHE